MSVKHRGAVPKRFWFLGSNSATSKQFPSLVPVASIAGIVRVSPTSLPYIRTTSIWFARAKTGPVSTVTTAMQTVDVEYMGQSQNTISKNTLGDRKFHAYFYSFSAQCQRPVPRYAVDSPPGCFLSYPGLYLLDLLEMSTNLFGQCDAHDIMLLDHAGSCQVDYTGEDG
jgi:hypothetical protein